MSDRSSESESFSSGEIDYQIESVNNKANDLTLLMKNTGFISDINGFADHIENPLAINSGEMVLGAAGFVKYLNVKKTMHKNLVKAMKKLTNHLEDKNGVYIFFNERFPSIQPKAVADLYRKISPEVDYYLIVSKAYEATEDEIKEARINFPDLLPDDYKFMPYKNEEMLLCERSKRTAFSIGEAKHILFFVDRKRFERFVSDFIESTEN